MGNNYSSEVLEAKSLSLGGRWAYLVMKIRDSRKTEKIRLAKCKINDSSFKNHERFTWAEIDPSDVEKFSQVQRMNFKSEREFLELSYEIKKGLKELEE